MEHSLTVKNEEEAAKLGVSLNPCFNGRYSRRQRNTTEA